MGKPDYYNSEHYPCPTSYYAEIYRMEKEKKRMAKLKNYSCLIYVCSPFAGDVKTNIKNARRYSRFVVKRGFTPITPHLLFPQFLKDDKQIEREIGIHMGLVLLSHCKEVWVFGKVISSGMQREIKKAKKKGIKIRRFNELLEEEK